MYIYANNFHTNNIFYGNCCVPCTNSYHLFLLLQGELICPGKIFLNAV